ncbi:MAG: hypothetical protein AAFO28_00585, partial [Pseudomonadota bacterium]
MRFVRVMIDGLKVSLLAGALACASTPLMAQEQAPSETAQESQPAEEPAPAPPAHDAEALAAAKVLQTAIDAWRARNFEGWIAKYHPD